MTDFGRDVSCTTSMRSGRFSTGARLVAEGAFRRLTTPRGMLRGGEEEQNYGLDLLSLIGSAQTAADAAALPGRIASELKKDERILTVEAKITPIVEGPATTFLIDVSATTDFGPFELQLLARNVTIELLGLKAAA